MEPQNSQIQEPVHLVRNKSNYSLTALIVILSCVGIVLILYGLYTYILQQQELARIEQEKIKAQQLYDSIPTQFAHFTYEISSNSAKVIEKYYVEDKLERLSKEGTFSATVKVVIPKNNTRDVHMEWGSIGKSIKYSVFQRDIKDTGYTATSITTPENFAVLNFPRYKDLVVKIRGCDAHNCVESKELYIPQEQYTDLTLNVQKIGEKVLLTWQSPRNAIKFNIFRRDSIFVPYTEAVTNTKDTSASVSIDTTKSNYFIVQQCDASQCWSSNEVLIEKD